MAVRRGSRGGAARRPVEWLGVFASSVDETVSTNSQLTLVTSAQLSEYIYPTIVRVRGVFGGVWSALSTNLVVPNIVIGIAVVTEQAAAALATPVADTDLDADWLLWDAFYPDASRVVADDPMNFERVFDSKAMRRINQPDNARIIMAISSNFDGATGNLRNNLIVRLLIKGD